MLAEVLCTKVERENYLPVDEDEFTTVGEPFLHDERNEYVYGLGESRGTIEKSGKVFTMEGRDALSYCWENGDPLYKLQPFYTVYNKKTARWYGIFYNNVSDSRLDMGAEGDVLWGCFRSYRAACGPVGGVDKKGLAVYILSFVPTARLLCDIR